MPNSKEDIQLRTLSQLVDLATSIYSSQPFGRLGLITTIYTAIIITNNIVIKAKIKHTTKDHLIKLKQPVMNFHKLNLLTIVFILPSNTIVVMVILLHHVLGHMHLTLLQELAISVLQT